ncbi:MAG: aminomethyl transferase family protein [Acidobacteria bacterium]|nr:MAG: aminomethyl transferase family protein [Acidobacteriota bacterium]
MPQDRRPDPLQPLRQGAALFDLSGRVTLFLEGAEAAGFLQGLVTNDVLRLGPGEGCDALFLTPKGKLRATATVLRLPQGLLLDTPPELRSRLPEILRDYLPFHPGVRLSDETGATVVLHLAGPRAGDVAAAAGAPDLPRSPAGHAEAALGGDAVRVVRADRTGEPGWDVRCGPTSFAAVLSRLETHGAVTLPPEALDAARVEAGLPWWGRELGEDVLPDEAGLTRTAVSYTKGCYVGQETVARLRTYGHVNRRLVGLLLDSGASAAPGDEVRAPEGRVGSVTSATLSARLGRSVALAYVRREHAGPGTRLAVAGAAGESPATVTPFPIAG